MIADTTLFSFIFSNIVNPLYIILIKIIKTLYHSLL
nr:MAG TPA: hypothetical protein [Caudoviricetes sp.]